MKSARMRLFYVLFLLISLCSVSLVCSLMLPSKTTVPSSGRIRYPTDLSKLRVNGTFILDSDGKMVKLVGFNGHVYHREPQAYQLYENDVAWIAERGFNVIRAVMDWSTMEPEQDDVYDQSYLALLDNLVSWCEKYSVYIILDMHQWGFSPKFGQYYNGVPAWVCVNYDDALQCAKDFWSGNGTGAYMQDKYVENWVFIASRYSGRDVVFAYDLFNEPHNPFLGMEPSYLSTVAPQIEALFARTINAIRDVDPQTIVIADAPCQYASDGGASLSSDIFKTYPNVIWGRSFYDLSSRNNYAKYPDGNVPSDLRQRLKDLITSLYVRFIKTVNKPFFLLEISSDDYRWNLGTQLWFNDTMKFFSEVWDSPYQLSFTWWRYCEDSSGWAPRLWNPPINDETIVVPILQDYILPPRSP